MEYRIVHIAETMEQEGRPFDSAYDAVDWIVSMSHRGEPRARNMYVLDGDGTRIFGPTDLYQMHSSLSV